MQFIWSIINDSPDVQDFLIHMPLNTYRWTQLEMGCTRTRQAVTIKKGHRGQEQEHHLNQEALAEAQGVITYLLLVIMKGKHQVYLISESCLQKFKNTISLNFDDVGHFNSNTGRRNVKMEQKIMMQKPC